MQTLIGRLNRATAAAMAAVECNDVFAEGASVQALIQLEQDLNMILPEDFKLWYLAHNGDAPEQQFYLLAGHDWLSVDVLVKPRRTLLSENFHTPMDSFHCWLYEAV